MMTKRQFISLANIIREHIYDFSDDTIEHLADWCQEENPSFNREGWIGYINGRNGPNGKKVK